MPIPFILGGIALAAAGYGAKKGYDAKCDYEEASHTNQKAKDIFDEAQKTLNNVRVKTNTKIEILGKLKFNIYNTSLSQFVDIYSKIQNIDFEDRLHLGLDISDINSQKVLDIKQEVFKIHEVFGGTVASLGGGALAGFGAFGGAGMLATASTGTAISSLSGVAATNATLAWFGGGSLAAGGFGMAGGMAILGGIVAGPVIGVAGFMLAGKAEEAKYQAYANYDKAIAYAEEMKTATSVVRGINKRVQEFLDILEPMQKDFDKWLKMLETILYLDDDYKNYSEKQKNIVAICTTLAITIKNVCDAPIIDKDGKITQMSKAVLEQAKIAIEKIESI